MNDREVEFEVVPKEVKLSCGGQCSGFMSQVDGPVRMSYPPQFLHRCNKCNSEEWVRGKQYPYMKTQQL